MAKINYLLSASVAILGMFGATANAAEINTNIARMQAMDKITGMVRVIDVPVNSEVKYGSFSIVVRACKTRPPEETPENFAFVDVVDNYKSENPVNIFRGWMISSSPSLNPVEHPIYDIWLLSCDNDKIDPRLKIMNEEELKAREQIPQRKQVSQDDQDKSNSLLPKLDEKSDDNVIAEDAPKVIEAPLEVEAVKNEVVETKAEEVVPDNNVQAPVISVSVPEVIENVSNNEGPQALINVTEPVIHEAKQEEVQVEENKLEQVQADVDARVVISAPETIEDSSILEPAPLILQEEPAPVQIDEVIAEDTINTEEVEENGMLDEQLIDFSE